MDKLLEEREKALGKAAYKIEKECGFKNGAYFLCLALMFIDCETWTFDKSLLARIYQALDLIEHNDELKKYFKENKDGEELSDGGTSQNDGGTEAQGSDKKAEG